MGANLFDKSEDVHKELWKVADKFHVRPNYACNCANYAADVLMRETLRSCIAVPPRRIVRRGGKSTTSDN